VKTSPALSTLVLGAALGLGVWGCGEGSDARENVLATVPTWYLEEELRIGREDDPDYALVPVGGLAVSGDQRILVSQPQERAIRVFDREGRFLHRIGRGGEGPGEFSQLGIIGVLAGTIWAVDCREMCFVQFFDEGGTWLDRVQTPRLLPPYIGTVRHYPLPDGGMLAPSATTGDIIDAPHEQPWLRSDPEGTVVDTLPGHLSQGLVRIQNRITLPDGRTVESSVGLSHPLSTRSWMGIAPDQCSLVRAEVVQDRKNGLASLLLIRLTPYGDTVASGELLLPRHPLPPAVVDSALDPQVARLAGPLGDQERARREIRSLVRVPDYYPPLRSLVVTKEGGSWLALDGPGETRWLVVDPFFNPLALVELPPRLEPAVIEGDMLWGSELNELDVPQVVRYRVVR
jgi:hypothetical protein